MKIRRQDKRAVPASTKMRTHAKERASGKDEGYEIIMAQCKRLKLYIYTYVHIRAYARAITVGNFFQRTLLIRKTRDNTQMISRMREPRMSKIPENSLKSLDFNF